MSSSKSTKKQLKKSATYTLRPLKGSKRENTQAALLRAAARILNKRGFRAATLQAIADEADVHVQTLYRHFPNRTTLITSLIRAEFEAFSVDVREALTHQDIISFYEAQIVRQIEFAGLDGIRNMTDLVTDPESGVSFHEVFREYSDLLAGIFARELDVSPLNVYARNLATLLFWGNFETIRRALQFGSESDLMQEACKFYDTVRQTKNVYADLIAAEKK